MFPSMNKYTAQLHSKFITFSLPAAEFGQLLQKSGISLTESVFIFVIQALVHANTI